MTEPATSVVARFERDAAVWEAETACMSSVTDMVLNQAYQRIVGLGPAAVPLIINRLRRAPHHFFWALVAIVGEDKAAGATTMPEAAQRWIDWYDSKERDELSASITTAIYLSEWA